MDVTLPVMLPVPNTPLSRRLFLPFAVCAIRCLLGITSVIYATIIVTILVHEVLLSSLSFFRRWIKIVMRAEIHINVV